MGDCAKIIIYLFIYFRYFKVYLEKQDGQPFVTHSNAISRVEG